MTVTLTTWHFASRPPERLNGGAVTRTKAVAIDADEWMTREVRLLAFDRRVHVAEDELGYELSLRFEGSDKTVERAADQFALRYQRLFARRNHHSNHAEFDRLLLAHASLHDRTKPLVRADHDHALDVWQWTLRLDPNASLALQIAALFHDIERLESEADVRIEQHASDYLGFKVEHARKGALLLASALEPLAVSKDVARRACALVERHEQPERDGDLNTLNEADALSWFALNSPGFLSYYGAPHTEKKVRFTLARMRSGRARAMLETVRLEQQVADMLRDAQRELAPTHA